MVRFWGKRGGEWALFLFYGLGNRGPFLLGVFCSGPPKTLECRLGKNFGGKGQPGGDLEMPFSPKIWKKQNFTRFSSCIFFSPGLGFFPKGQREWAFPFVPVGLKNFPLWGKLGRERGHRIFRCMDEKRGSNPFWGFRGKRGPRGFGGIWGAHSAIKPYFPFYFFPFTPPPHGEANLIFRVLGPWCFPPLKTPGWARPSSSPPEKGKGKFLMMLPKRNKFPPCPQGDGPQWRCRKPGAQNPLFPQRAPLLSSIFFF